MKTFTLLTDLGIPKEQYTNQSLSKTNDEKYKKNQNYTFIFAIIFMIFVIFAIIYVDFKFQSKTNEVFLKSLLVFGITITSHVLRN